MKTIYAFYQSLALIDQTQEFAKANLWKESWTRAGWKPVMLNSSHAQISPLRTKLMTKLNQAFPFIEAHEYKDLIQMRYSRLCALHAAGGGWISDYDVLNFGFTPKIAEDLEKNSIVIAGSPAVLMWISIEIVGAAINKFLNSELVQNGKMLNEQEVFGSFCYFPNELIFHARNYESMKEKFLEKK
jgi:hypothetical protein